MSILKELLKELYLKPGIYDLNGNFVKSFYGSDKLSNNGYQNIDKNYLLANNTIKFLKNAFNNKKINMNFLKYVLENNKTNINPISGYLINKDGNKINLYSLDRIVNIIANKNLDGSNITFIKDGNAIYMMNPIYEKFFESKSNKRNLKKKEKDDIKWEINKEIRGRYDKDEL